MTSPALPTLALRQDVRATSRAVQGFIACPTAFTRHAYIVPSFLISMAVCCWFVTWGDWKLFEKESFTGFYNAQARSILHGHLDVPPGAIGFEAFIRDGKTYGYFGIAPALLRVPLVLCFNGMDGQWSRSLMLAGCFINMLCAYRLVLLIRGNERSETSFEKISYSLFILCAGIGSTGVFLVSRSYTYHEAIMWGALFALLFTHAIISYFRRPRLPRLIVAGLFAFMSFHSRPTAGAGTLLAMTVVTAVLLSRWLWQREAAPSPLGLQAIVNPKAHALTAIAIVCLILGTYFTVNYARFRTFDGVPVRYYGMYIRNPGRMKVTGGRQIHFENIPTSLASYFGLRGVECDHEFPWVHLSQRPRIIGSPAIDVVEQYSSVPMSMPALFLLAVMGLVPLIRASTPPLRQLRLPAFSLMLGGGIMLATVGITQRYVHDLYPFLIVAGAVGICRFTAGKCSVPKVAMLGILTGISVALNCAFTFEYQRSAVWGVPATKRAEFTHLQQSFDRLLHYPPIAAQGE